MSFEDDVARAEIAEEERDRLAAALVEAEREEAALRDQLDDLSDAIADTERAIRRERRVPAFRGWVAVALALMLCVLGMTFAVLSTLKDCH